MLFNGTQLQKRLAHEAANFGREWITNAQKSRAAKFEKAVEVLLAAVDKKSTPADSAKAIEKILQEYRASLDEERKFLEQALAKLKAFAGL